MTDKTLDGIPLNHAQWKYHICWTVLKFEQRGLISAKRSFGLDYLELLNYANNITQSLFWTPGIP